MLTKNHDLASNLSFSVASDPRNGVVHINIGHTQVALEPGAAVAFADLIRDKAEVVKKGMADANRQGT